MHNETLTPTVKWLKLTALCLGGHKPCVYQTDSVDKHPHPASADNGRQGVDLESAWG